jgi:C_GCAxxG_C_C family probable redox protein
MPDHKRLRAKARELVNRTWDPAEMEAKVQALSRQGITAKVLDATEIISRQREILHRLQSRGEDYCRITQVCAKASVLALMEEFGLGNMEIVKALSPFPGFAVTGSVCGAVSGGFAALGLHFGSDDLLDYSANRRTTIAGREFVRRFEQEVGTLLCPEIQEVLFDSVLVGPSLPHQTRRDDASSTAKDLLGCCVLPGIAARIAGQIIIESLEDATPAS